MSAPTIFGRMVELRAQVESLRAQVESLLDPLPALNEAAGWTPAGDLKAQLEEASEYLYHAAVYLEPTSHQVDQAMADNGSSDLLEAPPEHPQGVRSGRARVEVAQ